jgi:hypothetical protein
MKKIISQKNNWTQINAEDADSFFRVYLRSSASHLIFFLLTFILASCSPLDNLLITSTPVMLTETPLPTATRIWFPASATPTLQPFSATENAKVPTPEMRPDIGDIILEDNFSDETLWDIASSNQASASINNNRLILSAQSEVYMMSLRRNLILTDFYAELTAQPSLCKGEDNYGMLIRASSATYYRFVLACDGTTRIERITNGARLILQNPEKSGDVPPGAPGNVRMGVWAVGKEMRFFLNGRFQFSIIDPSFPNGTIGVFARSVGSTPVIVTFSDLVIREIK